MLTQAVEHVVVVAGAAFSSDDKEEMKSKLKTLRSSLDRLKSVADAFVTKAGDNLTQAQKTRLSLDIKDFIAYQNDTVELGLTISPKAALIQANDDATVDNREKMVSRMEAFAQSALDRSSEMRIANAKRKQAIEAVMVGVPAFMIVAGSLIAVWVFATQIRRPLKSIIAAMQRVARGDLESAIPFVANADEIGELAQALVVFRDAAVEKALLEREAAERRAYAEHERERTEQAQREAIRRERAIVVESVGVSLGELASKNLNYRMSSEIPDAYRKLQADFNAAMAQLEAAMQKVAEGAETIHVGMHEISAAADDLSQRTEQQAATIEESAAALEQITETVKKAAEDARHARQIASAADRDALASATVVSEAVKAMAAIADSARQINQIIAAIDEIAFQTNLLALNAGIEAARAGEAGRGFAVVAAEVRMLAQRSAEAAKQIKTLIAASTRHVERGVELVGQTGATLNRMMTQLSDINSLVGAIADGAKEQSTSLSEINIAITQLDLATQQNAAMVEQSTAATHALSQEVAGLSSMVTEFTVSPLSRAESLRPGPEKAAA